MFIQSDDPWAYEDPAPLASRLPSPAEITVGLTPAQADAASHDGAILVLAGAGTGKTRTLAEIVKVQSPDRGAWRGAFNCIACKSVDFVVMDLPNGNPILVIELDDRTHARADRQERDTLVNEVLGAACIPLVRFKPSGKLDIRPHLPKQAILMRK